jgi:hypothetical protein
MPDDTDLHPPSDVAAVRAALMADLAPLAVVAEAIGKNIRTVQRLVGQGKLPTVTIGRTSYVVVSRARELLLAPKVRHSGVRRGRPRKAA